jgi:hypothetical protein
MGIAVRFSTVIWVEAMVGLSFLVRAKSTHHTPAATTGQLSRKNLAGHPGPPVAHVDTDVDTVPIAAILPVT